jgi:hypothetical protein
MCFEYKILSLSAEQDGSGCTSSGPAVKNCQRHAAPFARCSTSSSSRNRLYCKRSSSAGYLLARLQRFQWLALVSLLLLLPLQPAAASRPWHAVGVQQQEAPLLQQQQQHTWVPFSWTAAAKSSPSSSIFKSRILSALGWGLAQPVASTESSSSSSGSSVLWGSRFLSSSSGSTSDSDNNSMVVQSFDTPWWQGGDAAAAEAAATQSQNRPRISISDLQLPPDGSSSSTTSTAVVGSSNASSGTDTAPAAVAQPGGRRHLAQASSEPPMQGQQQQEQRQALFNSGALCSATINYGASVGDASKRGTADVPIFVGVFDVAVTAQQQVSSCHDFAGIARRLAGQCNCVVGSYKQPQLGCQ